MHERQWLLVYAAAYATLASMEKGSHWLCVCMLGSVLTVSAHVGHGTHCIVRLPGHQVKHFLVRVGRGCTALFKSKTHIILNVAAILVY